MFHSLNETHQSKAITYKGVVFYDPIYCAFGGSINPSFMPEGLLAYAKKAPSFFVVGEAPSIPSGITIEKEVVCSQMILTQPFDFNSYESIVPLVSKEQHKALFDLVNLVQPGYFKSKTAEMGRYFGIYKNNQLVAVTGERMRMNQYTEISAIVTHPDYTGNGYAKGLIKHTTDLVFQEGKIPYLHVVKTNRPAIGLYEKLGFTHRREITFWKLKHH
ncbi:MAG: GNAT family N-acetyltransferase [Flavobacteriaceae bacterium]